MYVYEKPKQRVTGAIGKLKGEGAVVKAPAQPRQTPTAGVDPSVRVYRSHQAYSIGPIGKMPPTWTIYDLIFEQTPEALKLRGMFDDWAIPETRTGQMENGNMMTRINTLRNFIRGNVRDTTYKVEQYLYAILNPGCHPVHDFGSPNGTDASRSNILVCCKVGDPRTGKLDQAYIEYALPLSTPRRDFAEVSSKMIVGDVAYPENREQLTFYKIKGDAELEKRIGDMWVNEKDFRFNAAIYPVARNFMADIFLELKKRYLSNSNISSFACEIRSRERHIPVSPCHIQSLPRTCGSPARGTAALAGEVLNPAEQTYEAGCRY